MSDVLDAFRGQIKVRVSNADDTNNTADVEIMFCAPFGSCRCVQLWSRMLQPEGSGLSPGGVPLQTEVLLNSAANLFFPFLFPLFQFLISVVFLIPIKTFYTSIKFLFLIWITCTRRSLRFSLLSCLSWSWLKQLWQMKLLVPVKNELGSESLCCLTALMMYLDEWMYSNFFSSWHTVLLLRTFFSRCFEWH